MRSALVGLGAAAIIWLYAYYVFEPAIFNAWVHRLFFIH
jgi:hypothetical protein